MKRRRGVTLIELIISLALFTIVMVATIGLVDFGLRGQYIDGRRI